MSRPRLVRSGTSSYGQVGSEDPDAMMSRYDPTTPSSQKSNKQLAYDYNAQNGTSISMLRTSPSQETPGSMRSISSPPPAHSGSRPGTSTSGSTATVIPHPGAAQIIQSRERSTNNANPQSYWSPLPRGYNTDNYDVGNRPAYYKGNYYDYETSGPHVEDNDTQSLAPTPPRIQQKQASVDPFPTDVQRIPVNADSPLHQMYNVRRAPSDSFRSLRYDTKKRSYRFDNLSDIESERGAGGRGGGGGSFYKNGRPSTPVEEILRLPMTWWMNSTAKNRQWLSILRTVLQM